VPDDFDEQVKGWSNALLEDFKTHPLTKDTAPLGTVFPNIHLHAHDVF
jgi:hypothetical protein